MKSNLTVFTFSLVGIIFTSLIYVNSINAVVRNPLTAPLTRPITSPMPTLIKLR